MALRTKSDFWSDVIIIREATFLNETERKNELKALELLWNSGYYDNET